MKRQLFLILILLISADLLFAQTVNYANFQTQATALQQAIKGVFITVAVGVFLAGALLNIGKAIEKEWKEYIKSLFGYLIAVVLTVVIYGILLVVNIA